MLKPRRSTFPYDIINRLADCLQRPNEGDIVFECPSIKDGVTKVLYAHSSVLKARSGYYVNSKSPETVDDHAKAPVFASSFSEGDSTVTSINERSQISEDPLNQITRRRIPMEDDFDVVHNVLYYMYTNGITFSNVTSENSSSKPGLPRICDAEDIYALAHRLELKNLQNKTHRFLKSTCNVRNITARVFSEFAELYEDVGETYESYFKDHWEDIRGTTEFNKYFSVVEEKEDLTEIRRVYGRFRELMEESSFANK